jgi:two-component system response regulator AtoC
LAGTEVPVLIRGEAGSGKRTAAHRIHQLSAHRNQPFVVLECAALMPEALAEGAESLFRAGTILLDEVCALCPSCQDHLMKILDRTRSGNGDGLRGRVILTTAGDLEAEVATGRFREDLYYRISGVCLQLPPLRQRRDDIPQFVTFFLNKHAAGFHRAVPRLSPEIQHWFQEYEWPGNVRELEELAKAMVVLGDAAPAVNGLRLHLGKNEKSSLNGEKVSLKEAARAASRVAEKELILKVLNRTRWNRRRAAQELQISYKALLYKLKQIGWEEEYGA